MKFQIIIKAPYEAGHQRARQLKKVKKKLFTFILKRQRFEKWFGFYLLVTVEIKM
jgi:hypothetical protein